MTPTQLFNSGAINRQQRVILSQLRRGKSHNRRLSVCLGLPINVITPRVSELRRLGYVTESGRVWDNETNRTVIVWQVI